MDLKILGPVAADLDGRTVALDGSKQRTAFAALLLAHGKVLTDERLTTLLWGWDPPATSTKQLYTYVSRLRTRLGAHLGLERHGPGYRMDIGDATFDWDVFRTLADAGRAELRAARYADAERALTEALALWRGPALSDVTGHLAEAEGPRMEEARLSTLENRTEAALALGRHTEAVPGLTRQVALNPLRERPRGQLMTALSRCGRQADALAVYEEGRRVLADDLGIDPGPALRTLHQEVLTGTLTPPQAPERHRAELVEPVSPVGRVPQQQGPGPDAGGSGWRGLVPSTLPAAPGDFTGRAAETEEVLCALGDQQDVVVTGAPGTGKSALALWAAERCRADFPQGRLYADLRTAPADGGGPRAPGEVLGWFLRALGIAPDQIPVALDERVQLYRTLLANRRMLIVLDNASDDTQVRPLLPGGASRTVVTGVRSPLASLEGTRLVRLGPMERAEANALLVAVAGQGRFTGASEAAARIAEFCDRLPLALRIAAARLAARPHWPAARLADRLAPQERRLGELRIGSLDVRVGLAAELAQLGPADRASFGTLARAGLSRLTAGDAAALLGTGSDVAEEVLERLADARLLDAWSVDDDSSLCYRFMPLVRLFAQEQCQSPTPVLA
ncbi:transcriptional regulator [Streptomyces sp. NBC_00237]|uniref:AfsR/SARP family transcriptional regulator n=1 Tax=Streptomyces sp. NBC_00237 TaxID=2975687 RepID=UPI00225364BA|nr:BTAD domain-containing putative transcriptional regulator [Streptomyces sp. NBC_00237]MCX5203682.1 transcriptional regulator [Streptomyces sp. NBC_00237]